MMLLYMCIHLCIYHSDEDIDHSRPPHGVPPFLQKVFSYPSRPIKYHSPLQLPLRSLSQLQFCDAQTVCSWVSVISLQLCLKIQQSWISLALFLQTYVQYSIYSLIASEFISPCSFWWTYGLRLNLNYNEHSCFEYSWASGWEVRDIHFCQAPAQEWNCCFLGERCFFNSSGTAKRQPKVLPPP